PWVGLAVGVALVLAGGLLLGGAASPAGLGGPLAGRLGGRARGGGLGGYLAYGLAYGLASLSCTLPVFLTVVGGALTADGLAPAAGQLVLYALGMGALITALTLATALFKHAVVGGVRRALPYVEPVSAVLLLLAGAYIIYYWLTIGGLGR
ncbi:MAG: cytochrome c biogenesis protein CcdA, partial [Chloroflexota bacterium]|nr:cytochrome c biogenesis protein CcdA [Chloroflexota bacterium]